MPQPTPASPSAPPPRDVAGVVALPPLIYVLGLLLGAVLDRGWPLPLLPATVSTPLAVLCGLAGLLVIPAIRAFRRAGTRPEPWKPTTALVTDGPFRFSRNPMYLGFSLIYLAVALSIGSGWTLALFPVVLLVMHHGVIQREERYLERRYGEAYRDYRRRVRRWL